MVKKSKEFGEVSLEDLQHFEKANDVLLPDDYKCFLTEHNGGKPVRNIIGEGYEKTNVEILFGMHDGPYYANFWKNIDMFCQRIPSWYIPIGADSGGNLFLMSLWEKNKGLIVFWNHEREAPEGEADQYFDNMREVAISFTAFMEMMVGYDE